MPVIQADATALPLTDATAGLAWCLGVLCTARDEDAQLAMLRELRRVVRPPGRIGLLIYLATTRHLDDPPEGNHFPTTSRLSTMLHAADLEVVQEADPGAMPPAAPDWQDRTAAVEREPRRRFWSTPQLAAATEQSDRIAAMLGAAQLTSQVLTLRRSG